MTTILSQLRKMDADQLAAWVCAHPHPNREQRLALEAITLELPFHGKAQGMAA
jgi:hypothetical protein